MKTIKVESKAELLQAKRLKAESALRDEMTVYPGHNYNGASSTIAKEKRDGLLRPFTKTQWEAMMGGK